jgi:hypothetical protein
MAIPQIRLWQRHAVGEAPSEKVAGTKRRTAFQLSAESRRKRFTFV